MPKYIGVIKQRGTVCVELSTDDLTKFRKEMAKAIWFYLTDGELEVICEEIPDNDNK